MFCDLIAVNITAHVLCCMTASTPVSCAEANACMLCSASLQASYAITLLQVCCEVILYNRCSVLLVQYYFTMRLYEAVTLVLPVKRLSAL